MIWGWRCRTGCCCGGCWGGWCCCNTCVSGVPLDWPKSTALAVGCPCWPCATCCSRFFVGAERDCKMCATLDGRLICWMSALFVMFRNVRTAGLQVPSISDRSEFWRFCPAAIKLPRMSGGRMSPGTGGTLAHRLISPGPFP